MILMVDNNPFMCKRRDQNSSIIVNRMKTTNILVLILIPLLIIGTVDVFAHHKDNHEIKGKAKGHDKDKLDDIISSAGGCSSFSFTKNPKAYARCMIIDTTQPRIISMIQRCVKIQDDTGIQLVLINYHIIPLYAGSYDWYCTMDEKITSVIAIDLAENSRWVEYEEH